MAKKKRVMNLPELGQVVSEAVSRHYKQLEQGFIHIEQPMMRAFRVASEPMANDIKAFMAQHHRSGDTIGSFNPGEVMFDPQADVYYFKLGFDISKGGFPALILEYGDSGSPMRMPNKGYFFMHFASRNNVDNVNKLIERELTKILKDVKG